MRDTMKATMSHTGQTSRHSSAIGFTLLEVLVAMTLLSLILLLMFNALNIGNRHWHAGEAKTTATDNRRLIRSFIRKQFEQTVPLLQLSQSANRLMFHGTAHSVLYASYLPAHHAGAGLYVLHIMAQDNRLTLQYLGLHEPIDIKHPPPPDAGNTRVLLEDISSLKLRYYGRDRDQEIPIWHDRWTAKNTLPELVHIELQHRTEGAWPAMIIPIRSKVSHDQPQLTISTETK